MKELKDYLNLYMDCEAIIEKSSYKMVHEKWLHKGDKIILNGCLINWLKQTNAIIKPILRPLSDMGKKEKKELAAIAGLDFDNEVTIWTPEQFVWLLKKQFDLFSLIESGLAINSTTLKK